MIFQGRMHMEVRVRLRLRLGVRIADPAPCTMRVAAFLRPCCAVTFTVFFEESRCIMRGGVRILVLTMR